MRALRIHGANDLRWEEVPEVEPGAEEVRLRVAHVGICGSDLHYAFHGRNGEFVIREPLVPGHELSATVDLDPAGTLAPGTPVTVHPARFGTPTAGLTDRPHLWPGGDYLGSAAVLPHRQGAAVERLVVPRDTVRVLPAGLRLERAALAEPLAVALHAVATAQEVTGARALVLGSGPIGLLCTAALLHRGAGEVTAADVRPEPLERARELGAARTVLVGQQEPLVSGYDVVLECSSVPASLTTAVRAAARAGIVVQVGILPAQPITVDLAPLVSKEVQLRGTFRFADEIDEAIALLAVQDRLDAVITHTLPAAQAAEAFAIAQDPARSGKVLLSL